MRPSTCLETGHLTSSSNVLIQHPDVPIGESRCVGAITVVLAFEFGVTRCLALFDTVKEPLIGVVKIAKRTL